MVDIIIVYCAKVFYINRQHFSSYYFYYDFELVLYNPLRFFYKFDDQT